MEREEQDPAAAAMAQWPAWQVKAAVDFLHHVKSQFAGNIYDEFLGLLQRFYTGESTDPHKVMADLYALLQGHADLVRHLDAFFPASDPVHAPPPTRPKRERRPTSAAAIADDDADTRRALTYLERVRSRGKPLHDRVRALILQLASDETLDAHQIYERARAAFGSKHEDLLRAFTEFLPVPTSRQRDVFLQNRRRARTEPAAPVDQHPAPAPKRRAVADNHVSPSAPAKRTRADDRRTTTNRRANSPAPDVYAAFRENWEFETTYSKLVETIRRTEELLKQYEPPTKKDAPAPPPRGRREFEELFPHPDCQEVLREMYHDMLPPIRAALEDGRRTELALRTIQRRLEMLERLGVKVAMERRDRDRVESRMQKLAVDRVMYLREKAATAKQRTK